jgi:hypothetical protein
MSFKDEKNRQGFRILIRPHCHFVVGMTAINQGKKPSILFTDKAA